MTLTLTFNLILFNQTIHTGLVKLAIYNILINECVNRLYLMLTDSARSAMGAVFP